MTALAARVAADLRQIAAWWPDLLESRIPGTPAPWRPSTLTPEQRAERDHEARLEWAERSEIAPGEHEDCVKPGTLDLITDVVSGAATLADEVSTILALPELPAPGMTDDPTPWLQHAAKHVDRLDDDHLAHFDKVTRGLLGKIMRHFGMLHDGQTLNMICLWCNGGPQQRPSWRVRLLPGDEIALVCESGTCDPSPKDVGTWWRCRPCWPLREWEWLARHIAAKEVAAKIAATA